MKQNNNIIENISDKKFHGFLFHILNLFRKSLKILSIVQFRNYHSLVLINFARLSMHKRIPFF